MCRSDEELVQAMASGDKTAVADLYDRHATRLFGVTFAVLRDRHDAEDVLHDVFLEAWRAARSFDRTRGTVATWLSVRARSRAIDRLNARRPAAGPEAMRAAERTTDDSAESRFARAVLRKA